MKKKITIIVDDDEDEQSPATTFPDSNRDENDLVIQPGSYYWEKQNRNRMEDNGWVDGIDRCANCPNRPGGPTNKSGFCMCAIPAMYGPNRITF